LISSSKSLKSNGAFVNNRPVIPSDSEHHSDSHTTFFRQSGLLVVATASSGVFMMATQMAAQKWMATAEYSVWCTLLRIYLLMSIPSAGLQIVFAQQAAGAVTDRRHHELAGTVRATLQATFVIWLLMALVAFIGQHLWITQLKIAHAAALWVTVTIGLASLWSPLVKGVLQGQQNFVGLGWVLILDGVGRFAAIVVILVLGGQAAGGMTGALIGQGLSLVLGIWFIRQLLREPGEAIPWRPWLRRVVPLTLGIGAVQFMCNADVVFVQGLFTAEQTTLYMPAAIIGLALVTSTTPMAAVMFPKIVRSAALAQDSRALRLALGATALLGGLGAVACTLLPWLPLRIIYFTKPVYWAAEPLVPWFAWCLLPLILANVLIGNLLARERFAVVPWVVLIAIGYGVALAALKSRLPALPELTAFRTVIQTLGVCSLCLFGVAAAFTWAEQARAAAEARGA
jgi:O-antigen/teichoic acid export membrane protein